MAKAYRALRDLAVPLVVGRPEEGPEETSGESFNAGALIPADRMTQFHRDQAESGALDHLLEPVEDDEAEAALSRPPGEPEFGVFVPEHEAERTALHVYGHATVPREQELELLSGSERYHDEYAQQAKEQGLDQRPVQEHMAQVGQERVPDHVLTGGETQAGMPHNRGPVEQEVGAEEYEDGEIPAQRPRPRLASREDAEGEQPSGVEGSEEPQAVGPEEPDRGNSDSESEDRVGEA